MNNVDSSLPTAHLLPPTPGQRATVLLQIGSFSPITIAHLRLLEAARDTLLATGAFVAGAYISPTNDAYNKRGLAPAKHRLAMCRLAVAPIPWVAVDPWDACATRFVRTHEVVSRVLASLSWPVQIYLVCGSDLIGAMNDPLRWPTHSVEKLKRDVRFLVKLRQNYPLCEQKYPMLLVEQWVPDLSSSLVRQYLRDGHSVRYMVPDSVLEYIEANRLYA